MKCSIEACVIFYTPCVLCAWGASASGGVAASAYGGEQRIYNGYVM